MKLRLVASSPGVEALIAAAVLTTTSGAQPSVLYDRMLRRPEKAAEVIDRIEVQHGSVLEHNRFTWEAEAEDGDVLGVLLRSRFFSFTRLGTSRWLVSGNLRAVIEYSASVHDSFAHEAIATLAENHPALRKLLGGLNA